MFSLFAVNSENEAKLGYGGETLNLLGLIVPMKIRWFTAGKESKAANNHRTGKERTDKRQDKKTAITCEESGKTSPSSPVLIHNQFSFSSQQQLIKGKRIPGQYLRFSLNLSQTSV